MLSSNYSESERFELLRQVAELYDPLVWSWAYDTWKILNEKYFNGELKVGPIEWGLTEHGRSLGRYTAVVNKITLHTSLLKPHSSAWNYTGLLGERMAEDVILHEMLHQSIFQKLRTTRDEKGRCHNYQPWCDEINRLNPLLGLPGIATISKQRRIKEKGIKGNGKAKWMPSGDGTLTLKELSSWPHSLRPEGYYEASCKEMLERRIKCNTQ